MPVGPRASQSQLEQAYRSIRKMNQSEFREHFRESLKTISTYEGSRGELAIGLSVGGNGIEAIGDPIVNEPDVDGGITRFYSHEGTDFALHLRMQSSLETFEQFRALLLFELADSIHQEQNTFTMRF